ncbi:MAG: hypothetical protein IH804_08250, partial [Planctomycetes bacterium]|nr:hypothetical protein [Planctomycetota bacterium]
MATLVVGIATLVPAAGLQAQFTWDGGGPADDFFVTPQNWDPNGPPPPGPPGLLGQNLIFGAIGFADTPDAQTDN